MLALLTAPLFAEDLPVLWSPSGFPPTLRDVASRLPADTDAREACLITYAHEANHFLCRGKPGYHAIYVGNGRRWEIPTPPLATEEVFAAFPGHAKTGTLYQTYLRQGRSEYWALQPLMILDEWRAYTVGSLVRQELGQATRAETVRHTESFALYAQTLYEMANEIEGYDTEQLRLFCQWNLEQCRRIEGFKSDVKF